MVVSVPWICMKFVVDRIDCNGCLFFEFFCAECGVQFLHCCVHAGFYCVDGD